MKMLILTLPLIALHSIKASERAVPPAAQQNVSAHHRLAGETRKFSVQYVGKITAIPQGTKQLRVWLPAPQSSSVQVIEKLEFHPPARLTTEPKYGNSIGYLEIANPATNVDVKMSFNCTRHEIRLDLSGLQEDGKEPSAMFDVFKKPDKLVLVDDEMETLSRQITAGKRGTLAKARAIYDYVLSKMTYDKNHAVGDWGAHAMRAT